MQKSGFSGTVKTAHLRRCRSPRLRVFRLRYKVWAWVQPSGAALELWRAVGTVVARVLGSLPAVGTSAEPVGKRPVAVGRPVVVAGRPVVAAGRPVVGAGRPVAAAGRPAVVRQRRRRPAAGTPPGTGKPIVGRRVAGKRRHRQ